MGGHADRNSGCLCSPQPCNLTNIQFCSSHGRHPLAQRLASTTSPRKIVEPGTQSKLSCILQPLKLCTILLTTKFRIGYGNSCRNSKHVEDFYCTYKNFLCALVYIKNIWWCLLWGITSCQWSASPFSWELQVLTTLFLGYAGKKGCFKTSYLRSDKHRASFCSKFWNSISRW